MHESPGGVQDAARAAAVDLFPLPAFPFEHSRFSGCQTELPSSRLSLSRTARTRRARVRQVKDAVAALNWLSNVSAPSSTPSTAAQKSALRHIWNAVKASPPVDVPTSPHRAASDLLQLGRAYDGLPRTDLPSVGVAPFRRHWAPASPWSWSTLYTDRLRGSLLTSMTSSFAV